MKFFISTLLLGFFLSFSNQAMAQEVEVTKTEVKKECSKSCCAKTEHTASMEGEQKAHTSCSKEMKANCSKADKKECSKEAKANCTKADKENCKKKCNKEMKAKKEEKAEKANKLN